MIIDDELRSSVQQTMKKVFGNTASRVEIASMEVDEDISEIFIVMDIESDATMKELAARYLDLTGEVRDTLGYEWRNFFPVIRPNIKLAKHA